MLLQENKKELPVEPKKPRKKSRWFFADTHFKDVEEQKRLKEDIDYRIFKKDNF